MASQTVYLAQSGGLQLSLVEGLLVQGMLAAQAGRGDEPENLFGEAHSLAVHIGYPYAEGRVL